MIVTFSALVLVFSYSPVIKSVINLMTIVFFIVMYHQCVSLTTLSIVDENTTTDDEDTPHSCLSPRKNHIEK